MPNRPKRPCGHHGCPELVERGERYCSEHKKKVNKEYNDKRKSASKQGYNYTWRKVRELALRDEPLCRMCLEHGKTRPADTVHHIDENPKNNKRINLMPLCKSCHNKVHGRRGV